MPIQDGRVVQFSTPGPRPKRKLGKRDQEPVKAEILLSELVTETVSMVARVLDVGGSVQFGSTRDGSAILIRAWLAGDVYEDYVKSVGEMIATLEALDDIVQGQLHRDTPLVPERPVRRS